ncbi:MAG: protein phosphatase 2C domain-containing protein [Myxococcota bacterium]
MTTQLLHAAVASHIGRRSNHEDAACVHPDLGLYVVADGMGGYEGGEVAASIVIQSVASFFSSNLQDQELTWPVGYDPTRTLRENLVLAGLKVADLEVQRRKVGSLRQMGATVVVVAIEEDAVVIGHVGDSRVYRFRQGSLQRLTRDHSLAEELGLIAGARDDHALAHVVTRAIGTSSADAEIRREAVAPGDRFLLCSDGLSDPLSDSEIAEILGREAPADAAQVLVRRAYERGGQDNITAMVLSPRG